MRQLLEDVHLRPQTGRIPPPAVNQISQTMYVAYASDRRSTANANGKPR
ncbi:MAG: hypothetical protein ABSE99_04150 [Terracidiphilus sp.]